MHNHSNGNELRFLMQIKLISLTIVEHQDSFRNRDKQQLGNGPLRDCVRQEVRAWKSAWKGKCSFNKLVL